MLSRSVQSAPLRPLHLDQLEQVEDLGESQTREDEHAAVQIHEMENYICNIITFIYILYMAANYDNHISYRRLVYM